MTKACEKCDPSPEEAANGNAATQFNRTPLMKAARDGHTKCVDALIKQGADVNAYDENISTALIRAADKGRVQCVERLLKAGADVNFTNMYGINALISASYEGHVDCVRVLLEKGASHKAPKRKRPRLAISSPLYYAVVIGKPKVVDLLLRAGASFREKDNGDHNLVMLASKSYLPGHLRCLELLIKAGASVNTWVANSSIEVSGCVGKSEKIHIAKPVHTPLAAAGHNKAKLRLLIESGANVNSSDRDGMTELMYAAVKGRTTAVKLLLEAGADVNAQDHGGRDVLSYAAVGHLEFLCFGGPPSMFVPNEGIDECIQIMVDWGADVNMRSRGRQTPIWSAAYAANVKSLKVLLKAGADVNVVDAVYAISPLSALKEIIYSYILGEFIISEETKMEIGIHRSKKQLFNDIFTCCRLLLASKAHVNLEFNLQDNAANVDRKRLQGHKHMIENCVSEGACGGCALRNKSLKLLYAAGEMQGIAAAPGVTPEDRMSLVHMCREKIRNHLINLDPHENLFVRIHMLGLENRLQSYLLYDTSLEYPAPKKRQRKRNHRGRKGIKSCGCDIVPWIGPNENDDDNDDIPLCRGCNREIATYQQLDQEMEDNIHETLNRL